MTSAATDAPAAANVAHAARVSTQVAVTRAAAPWGEFAGQCAVVTGAASGIGLALAHALLQAGARVIALDADAAGLHTLAQGVALDQLACHAVDVADAAAVAAVVADGQRVLGPVDKLACAAGVLQMGRIVDLTDEQWIRSLNVNATGVFNVCRVVARGMIERRAGAIVNVSSNAATTPRSAMGAYAASKAAVTQLTRCLALELAEYGIRCNIVSPGSTDTAMQRVMWRQGSSAEMVIAGSLSDYRLGIPLRKIATPQEIVDAILFLLSDCASHITLHDLRVDGGATLDR